MYEERTIKFEGIAKIRASSLEEATLLLKLDLENSKIRIIKVTEETKEEERKD